MKKIYSINYPALPVMAVVFTRSKGIIARCIQFCRKILTDTTAPNHALIVTDDHGQKFGTEETIKGLVENSLEKYTTSKEHIVSVMYWKGFNNPETLDSALRYLSEIRRRAGEDSKYDVKGLFSFVPILKKFIRPDPVKQWCSENVASVLKRFGATWIDKTTLAPEELLAVMMESGECLAVDNYYI